MKKYKRTGIDLAKYIIQACAVDYNENCFFNKALRRAEVMKFFSECEPCLIGIEGRQYKSGREFAANLVLVTNQHSSGGKTRLGSIAKRADSYLRTLLVHCARSVIFNDHSTDDLC